MDKGIVQADVAAAILPHLTSEPRTSQHLHPRRHKKTKREEEKEEEDMRLMAEAAAEALLQATNEPYDGGQGTTSLMGGPGQGEQVVVGQGGPGLDVPMVLGIILRLCASEEGILELMSGAHNASLGLTDDFEWSREAVDYLRTTAETVAPFTSPLSSD